MQSNKSQIGSIHAIVIILIVLTLIGAVGFVFWNNFLKETSMNEEMSDSSQSTRAEDKEGVAKDPYDGWSTQTSITSSGLSFKYPPEWDFTPADKEFVNTMGGKSVTHSLYSKKPKVESVNGGPVTTNQFMCVAITEYTGHWQYSKATYSNELDSEKFSIAGKPVLLNTYSDASLGRDNRPMGNVMRLIGSQPGSKGQAYIDTNNGYVVEVTAQYNCMQGGEGIEDLNADFEKQPDTMAAKLIMKSIKF